MRNRVVAGGHSRLTVISALAVMALMVSRSQAAEVSYDKKAMRPRPQTDYVHAGKHCRVSLRITKADEEYAYLAVAIENLGREDLTIYNPFFHPICNPICIDAQTAGLIVFDEHKRGMFDLLDRRWGGSYVAGVAESWVSIRARTSWSGRCQIPRRSENRERFYIQAIFFDRFVSEHPFGRPAWPIDGDFSPKALTQISTYIRLGEPRVKAWRDRYTGRELFRSNVVVVTREGPIGTGSLLALEPVEAIRR